MNSTATARPPGTQPIGTDRRGHLRIARFVCGHSACASWLLWQFVYVQSLFLPLRLPGLPLPTLSAQCGCYRVRTDDALFMSVATSNANMSSGAMVMGAIAVPTVIIRTAAAAATAIIRTEAIAVTTVIRPTGVIDPGRGPGDGYGYGGVGRRWPSPYVGGYERVTDMRKRRGRQRRFRYERRLLSRSYVKPSKCRQCPATRSNIAGTASVITSSGRVAIGPPRRPLAMFASGPVRDLSISERRARKHDVGADREPEGVIAHDRYLDEHAKDREDHHNERSNKAKVHCAYLLGLRRNAQDLAA